MKRAALLQSIQCLAGMLLASIGAALLWGFGWGLLVAGGLVFLDHGVDGWRR